MKRVSSRQSSWAAKAAAVGSLAVAGCLVALPATAQDLSAQGLLVQGPLAGTVFADPGMSITSGGGYRVGFGDNQFGGGFGDNQFGGGFGDNQFGGGSGPGSKSGVIIPDNTTTFDMPNPYFDEHRSISPRLQSPAPGGSGSPYKGLEAPEIIPL